MKTILLSASLVFSLLAGASGTKEKNAASYRAIQSFKTEFGQVEDVKWSSAMNNMTKADFILDDEPVTAFFDEAGEFVASTRAVAFETLPKALRTSFNAKMPGAKILTLFEVSSQQERVWFLQTQYNNEVKVWKGSAQGNLSRYFERN